jgi:hypothetical protein
MSSRVFTHLFRVSLASGIFYSSQTLHMEVNSSRSYHNINKKQTSVALSMAEVEYIAACSASSEAVWLQKLLAGLFDLELEATCIWCDNQSCVKLTKNLVFHDKFKHIKIRYHYIRDMVRRGAVKLQYVVIDEQIAYVLTKSVSRVKFVYFRDKLGVVHKDIPSKRE